MNSVFIVARKEVQQILKNWGAIATALFFLLFFGGLSIPSAIAQGENGIVLDRLGFFVFLLLGIFMGYILSGQVFLREKQEGVIETLLCCPLSLQEIWLGKVIGVTIVASGLTLGAAGILLGGAYILIGDQAIDSLPLMVYLLLVIPTFIAASVGLLGFAQLLLGMRENQFLNIAMMVLLIVLLSFFQGFVGPEFRGSWGMVGVLFAIALGLLFVVHRLTWFLEKERIVLTIP